MNKKHYLKELILKETLQRGGRGKDVKKVQEWLNIWRYIDPSWRHAVTIDGDFGQQTETVIKEFQQTNNVPSNGAVNQATFDALCQPLVNAFTPIADNELRTLIVAYARQHLDNFPVELNNRNEGPWVRAYMDGNEGPDWPWCMGFVQTVIDQAFSTLEMNFKTIMPHTYSCDVLAMDGRSQNRLMENRQLRIEPERIQPGDIFLNVRVRGKDWTHTGIILNREGDWIHTIEGNTNAGGSREGMEVRQRMRNFMANEIDVFIVR